MTHVSVLSQEEIEKGIIDKKRELLSQYSSKTLVQQVVETWTSALLAL